MKGIKTYENWVSSFSSDYYDEKELKSKSKYEIDKKSEIGRAHV